MARPEDIAQWRTYIFTSMMSGLRIVALAAAVPSAIFGIIHNLTQVALMDAVALVWILILWRLDRLSYKLRVYGFLALLFGVGIGTMIMTGALGLSYLMAPPIMAVILLGMRSAFITLAVSASCMMALGMTGHSQLPIGNFPRDSFAAVTIFTLNFACVSGFITLTCGTLLTGLSGSLTDVRTIALSLRKKQFALDALNGDLRLTSAALGALNEMVLIAKVVEGRDVIQPVIFANPAFERCSGYSSDEIIGRSMRMLLGPDSDPAIVSNMLDATARRESVSGELVIYKKSGEPCWLEIDIVPFSNEGSVITHWVAVGRDITERRRSVDAINQLAFFDVLTGLANRRLLMERLDAMVNGMHTGRQIGAVLYIDLDNFKHVNDARGHATGDALLKHIAGCLTRAVHEYDTVARLGGDEFVILLEDLGYDSAAAIAAAHSAAERVRGALTQGVSIDNQMYYSSGSIGIALPTRLGHTVQDLLREADTAMYHAKTAGRNSVAMFESQMLTDAENTLTLERDLLNAISNEELALHLQLQVGHDGLPIGAEVLLRWRRTDGILVPPDIFIPIAEATGLIVPIGAWVLHQTCMTWCELNRMRQALPLSINVSPRQFRQASFVADTIAEVTNAGVPPEQLIFEVTEGLLVDDLRETVSRMHQLAQFGIRFSIDDFGTGYSNLGYLRQMPLFELKIDKSFIRDMPNDINSTAIVQSILAMASHLNLRVVAEGIETAEQAQFLEKNGNPFMQGYFFCKPMPLEDFLERTKLDYSIKKAD